MSPLSPSFPTRVLIAAAVPVRVATDVAVTSPVVAALMVLKSLAATEPVSVIVTASSPNPESPLEAYAVFISAAAPVMVVAETVIVPAVAASRVLRVDAVIEVSVSV